MSVFSAAIDAIFADPNFGTAARYTPPSPPGGAAVPCLVLLDFSDAELGGLQTTALVAGKRLEVRASEVPQPLRGGTFGPPVPSVPGRAELTVSYTVLSDPRANDADRLVWSMTVG